MPNRIITLCCCLIAGLSQGQTLQNFVQNPSFEMYKRLPDDLGQVPYASFWSNPTQASPDFFHERSSAETVDVPRNKMGKAAPRTGMGYAGIYVYTNRYTKRDFREYLQVQLKQPLNAGERYCIKAHVYLAESSNRSISTFGASLARVQLEKDHQLPIDLHYVKLTNPEKGYLDRRAWYEIKGSYEAIGGERYLIIGNFESDKATLISGAIEIDSFLNPNVDFAYYFIDDVCVTSLKSNFNCECGSFEYDVTATREKIVLDFAFQPKTYEVGQEFLLDSVRFQAGRALFLPGAQAALDDLIGTLNRQPHYAFEISGHTANQGDPEENQQLSTRRAKAVYDYLVAGGIAAERLSYRGYGESRPIALNDTPQGRELNERIRVKRLR